MHKNSNGLLAWPGPNEVARFQSAAYILGILLKKTKATLSMIISKDEIEYHCDDIVLREPKNSSLLIEIQSSKRTSNDLLNLVFQDQRAKNLRLSESSSQLNTFTFSLP